MNGPKYAWTSLTPSKWDIVRRHLIEAGETDTYLYRGAQAAARTHFYIAAVLLRHDERERVHEIIWNRFDTPQSRHANARAARLEVE